MMAKSSLPQITEEQEWLENASVAGTSRMFIDQDMQTENLMYAEQNEPSDKNIQNMFDDQEMQDLHELNLIQRKKALMKSEMQLTRREMAFERRKQNLEACEGKFSAKITARVTLDMIAELLDYFKGNSEDFLCWSKQLLALEYTYGLSDDETKVLMAMRMQGRAKKWLLWNPEIIGMGTMETLEQLKHMFYHKSGRMVIRKKFEERVWEKHESFDDYFYDKLILAKRIPIDDKCELVDNIVDGIQDEVLRNLAKMHCFETPEELIQAFEQLSLCHQKGQKHQSEKFEEIEQIGGNGHGKSKKKRK